ncbi:MAG: Na+/H+ antiporter NhaA [Solirubrobacteraceae bacterium]
MSRRGAATALALLWANLAGDLYHDVREAPAHIGPGWLQLQLTVGDWVADGLLALFFFVAGIEVKRELTVGQLADRRAAMLPFFAAGGGMLVPALVAIAVSGGAVASGGAWAIALVAWVCIHASGIHASVTGIMLGLLTPVRPLAGGPTPPVERYEHRLHPLSAGVVVPLFALVAAGIPLATADDALTDPIALGVFAGLLAGKFAGVCGDGGAGGIRVRVARGAGASAPARAAHGTPAPGPAGTNNDL